MARQMVPQVQELPGVGSRSQQSSVHLIQEQVRGVGRAPSWSAIHHQLYPPASCIIPPRYRPRHSQVGATKAASCTSPPKLPRYTAAAAARMESEVASTDENSNSAMRSEVVLQSWVRARGVGDDVEVASDGDRAGTLLGVFAAGPRLFVGSNFRVGSVTATTLEANNS